jgi:hypothetical protein
VSLFLSGNPEKETKKLSGEMKNINNQNHLSLPNTPPAKCMQGQAPAYSKRIGNLAKDTKSVKNIISLFVAITFSFNVMFAPIVYAMPTQEEQKKSLVGRGRILPLLDDIKSKLEEAIRDEKLPQFTKEETLTITAFGIPLKAKKTEMDIKELRKGLALSVVRKIAGVKSRNTPEERAKERLTLLALGKGILMDTTIKGGTVTFWEITELNGKGKLKEPLTFLTGNVIKKTPLGYVNLNCLTKNGVFLFEGAEGAVYADGFYGTNAIYTKFPEEIREQTRIDFAKFTKFKKAEILSTKSLQRAFGFVMALYGFVLIKSVKEVGKSATLLGKIESVSGYGLGVFAMLLGGAFLLDVVSVAAEKSFAPDYKPKKPQHPFDLSREEIEERLGIPSQKPVDPQNQQKVYPFGLTKNEIEKIINKYERKENQD